jgi:hypothetical protein
MNAKIVHPNAIPLFSIVVFLLTRFTTEITKQQITRIKSSVERNFLHSARSGAKFHFDRSWKTNTGSIELRFFRSVKMTTHTTPKIKLFYINRTSQSCTSSVQRRRSSIEPHWHYKKCVRAAVVDHFARRTRHAQLRGSGPETIKIAAVSIAIGRFKDSSRALRIEVCKTRSPDLKRTNPFDNIRAGRRTHRRR